MLSSDAVECEVEATAELFKLPAGLWIYNEQRLSKQNCRIAAVTGEDCEGSSQGPARPVEFMRDKNCVFHSWTQAFSRLVAARPLGVNISK
jgi:hypothetical protein